MPLRCCRLQRLSVVKRWQSGSHFRTIERCRRCGTWLRREIEIAETHGRLEDGMTTQKLIETEITSTPTVKDAS